MDNKQEVVTALIQLAETQARNVLMGLHQDLMPTWVIIPRKGNPMIEATPWRNDREKRLGELIIRALIRKHKAVAYSFVTEAWAAHAPDGWDPDSKTPMAEADRPVNRVDRWEIVVACATDGENTEWRRWHIKRDWQGHVSELVPQEIEEGEFESWISQLLVK